jgi:hypothetical protein
MDLDTEPRHPGTDPGSWSWKMIRIRADPAYKGVGSKFSCISRGGNLFSSLGNVFSSVDNGGGGAETIGGVTQVKNKIGRK